MPAVAEREALKLLAGVGNEREWWVWVPAPTLVGHLRVGVSEVENAAVDGCVWGAVLADAGESGPERARTPAPW